MDGLGYHPTRILGPKHWRRSRQLRRLKKREDLIYCECRLDIIGPRDPSTFSGTVFGVAVEAPSAF